MNHIYLIICTLATICYTSTGYGQTYSWKQKANYGGGGIYDPFSFVINNKAYVGTGVAVPNIYLQSFWEYDPSLDIWTQKANFIGTARYGARGFAIGNYGYAGTGWGPSGNNNNFYRYDPSINSWAQVSSFPGTVRYTATAFVAGNAGYVGLGYSGCKNDFWKFNPATGSWSQSASYPGPSRQAAASFVINDIAYVGTGLCPGNLYNDFYKYNYQTNSWTSIASFNGPARNAAFSFTIGTDGYVVMGFNYDGLASQYTIYNDVWKYNSIADTWTQMPNFPGTARFEGFSFSVGNKAFIGVGNNNLAFNNVQFMNDLWEYSEDSTTGENNAEEVISNLNIFPIPSNDQITLEFTSSKIMAVEVDILNIQGQIVMSHEINCTSIGIHKIRIPISGLSKGIYFIKSSSLSEKLVKFVKL